MKRFTRVLAVALAAIMVLTGLTGCSKESSLKPTEDLSTIVAATYGDTNIYMDEANFFLRYSQWYQEASYWYLYTQYMGYEDMWSIVYDESGKTLGDNLKETVMQQIHQTLVLCEAAEQYGLSMDDVDEEAVKAEASEVYADLAPEFFEYAPVTEDQIAEWFMQNALAVLVHEAIVDQVEVNVTDEECEMFEVNYVLITDTVSTANAETEEEETEEEETEEETEAADETEEAVTEETTEETTEEETTAAEEYDEEEGAAKIAELVNAGEDFDTVLSKYGLSATTEHYHVQAQEDETELVVNCRALTEGQADSFESTEDNGWYVAVRTNTSDEEASESERESMIEERKDEGFNEVYTKLQEEGPAFSVTSAYEDIIVGEGTEIYVEAETEEETEETLEEAAEETTLAEETVEESEELTEGSTEATTGAED